MTVAVSVALGMGAAVGQIVEVETGTGRLLELPEVDELVGLLARCDLSAFGWTETVVVKHVEAGQIAPGATSRLVDAVLDLIQVPAGTALEMTFPTGEAEMLEQIRSRCPDVTTRVAGVSCRLHTTVPTPHHLHPATRRCTLAR